MTFGQGLLPYNQELRMCFVFFFFNFFFEHFFFLICSEFCHTLK